MGSVEVEKKWSLEHVNLTDWGLSCHYIALMTHRWNGKKANGITCKSLF